MSIISVVYLPEGIVLAADSRLTGRKEYKDDNDNNVIELQDFNIDLSLIISKTNSTKKINPNIKTENNIYWYGACGKQTIYKINQRTEL